MQSASHSIFFRVTLGRPQLSLQFHVGTVLSILVPWKLDYNGTAYKDLLCNRAPNFLGNKQLGIEACIGVMDRCP